MARLSKMPANSAQKIRGHVVHHLTTPEGGAWDVELHHPSGLTIGQSFSYGHRSATHWAKNDAALAANRFIRNAPEHMEQAYNDYSPYALFNNRSRSE